MSVGSVHGITTEVKTVTRDVVVATNGGSGDEVCITIRIRNTFG